MRSPQTLSGHRIRSAQRGSVILLVLGVVLLTAFLLTRLMDRARTELQAESLAARRASLREEAYSALETTLAVLSDASAAQRGLHTPAQGWDKPLEFARYEPARGREIEVIFDDETGRLSLPQSDEPTLQRLLVVLGATQNDAESLTDALFAWTKSGHVPRFPDSDPERYENERHPYRAPQRALRSWEELRAIPVARELLFDEAGDWNELGRLFRANVSLHRFARVNVNTATPDVLVALGLNPARVDTLHAPPGRDDIPPSVFHTAEEATTALGPEVVQPGLGADVLCLRVKVAVREGGRAFHLAATVQPGAGRAAAPDATAPDPALQENTPRSLTRKNIDYPFAVLELRESDHPLP